MGSVVSMLGMAGGARGTGFEGPQYTGVVNPTDKNQIDQAYGQTQTGLQGQQNLLQALQAQNGLQNQSSVFNQLQGVANGTGPNPAQAQLANATGANIAAQNALMAGQRGSSSNPALMARQAAMQGANINQQSAGQAASMQAQQSLNALNQMGGMAGQQAANQIGQTNANLQAQQAQHQALMNAQLGVNQNNVTQQAGINAANAGLAAQGMKSQDALVGGLMKGASAAFGANGGMIQKMADGGGAFQGPSKFGQFVKGAVGLNNQNQQTASAPVDEEDKLEEGASALTKSLFSPSASTPSGSMAGGAEASNLMSAPTMMAAHGGSVPAMLSPGEKYLSPEKVSQVKQGADPMSIGKEIPGKPKVKGAKNSYDNDTVSATLEEGGIVLPRSVTQSKNPHWAAHKFVSEIMARQAPKKVK